MSCLSHAAYTMKADVYKATKTQDTSSGVIQNVWALDRTIACQAKGIIRDSVQSNSSAVDIANYLVNLSNVVKLRSAAPLSSEDRVVAIRNASGVIWTESDVITSQGGLNNATIFEPRGSTPVINFDGKVIEYETVLQRQEIQTLETS